MKKIVFAGGTHCGKTTLVEYFAKEGYGTVPESGIVIINECIERVGWDNYRSWRLAHQDIFVQQMLEKQVRFEEDALALKKSPYVFYDRGIIDYFSMAKHLNVSFDEKFAEYARTSRYDAVFLCEPLSHFDSREKAGRTFTRKDSTLLTTLAGSLYREFGYEPIHLPDIPIPERVAIIKRTIAELFPNDPLRPRMSLPE